MFAPTPDEIPLAGLAAEVAGLWFAKASWVPHSGGCGRQIASMLLKTGNFLVDPERLAPGHFATWSDEEARGTALGHYQGIYDVH